MVTKIVATEMAPRRVKMSYEEYLEFAGEDRIVEWIDIAEGYLVLPLRRPGWSLGFYGNYCPLNFILKQ